MARKGLSEAQVFEEIEAMLEEGQKVTVTSVRERIGSGSYSTISSHLAKWREANDNRKPANIPEMPPSVDSALRKVWALAWQESQQQIKVERDGLDAVRGEIEREKKDMASEIARLEDQNTAQGDELTKAVVALSDRTKALSGAENALNELKLENARLDERGKSSESRAGELKQELDKLHERFKEVAAAQKKPRATRSRAKPVPKKTDDPAP